MYSLFNLISRMFHVWDIPYMAFLTGGIYTRSAQIEFNTLNAINALHETCISYHNICNTWHVKDHNYYLLFHIRIYHCYSLIKCYSFINTFVSHRPRDNAGKYTRCRPIFRSGNSSTRDRFAMPRGRIVFASYLKKKGGG